MILTKNEETALPRALASLPGGMPVLVVDAESTDATVAIARDAGARTVVRPWEGFVATRRFALGAVTTPWTLMIDADEWLDAELRESLAALPDAPREDGFIVSRTTWLCGRRIHGCGWGEEPLLRLLRTETARLEARPAAGGEADLHERWNVSGAAGSLAGTLEHESYPTLRSYGAKFASYTSIEALGLDPKAAGLPQFAAALARAVPRALWLFIGRGGIRDGWRGAFVSGASALYPVVVRWKAWMRREGRVR